MAAKIIPSTILSDAIAPVQEKKKLSEGITAMKERAADFRDELEMNLAGIGMVPAARDVVWDSLTSAWGSETGFTGAVTSQADYTSRELVIGAGFHAAVYCAARCAMGFLKPYVVDRTDAAHIGGTWAMGAGKPGFWLNSRSRPGQVGSPDQDGALNYIPGGVIQPSMLSSGEYPSDADMGFAVRASLAQFATVIPGQNVTEINSDPSKPEVTIGERVIRFGRVIDARGCGDPISEIAANGTTILTFPQFIRRMTGMMPLRGVRRIAVIGGGDSAKCAVESLFGLSPGHSSPIGMDYMQGVDWYAGGNGISTPSCDEFRSSQRGRYIRIAQQLEGNTSNRTDRLRVFFEQGNASSLIDGVMVNGRTYDMCVMVTGNELPLLDYGSYSLYRPNGTALGRKSPYGECYKIGPAAQLPYSTDEAGYDYAVNPNNQVAMFRLAPRTSALAASLPAL